MLNRRTGAEQFGALEIYSFNPFGEIPFPFFDVFVNAGFPSPATDYPVEPLTLTEYVEANPIATFFARVRGDSMIDAGIFDGDLIVIDRSKPVRDGDIVLANLRGAGFTVKRVNLSSDGRVVQLLPANKSMSPIILQPDDELELFGVVTYTIKNHYHKNDRARRLQ
jgi:DNA polymerase V